MLLNNFLYTRSLIQNEQFHFRTSFSSLIPKKRVNEDLKNPLEDEKYKEEIKNIHIGGRNRKEKRLQREKENGPTPLPYSHMCNPSLMKGLKTER